MIEFRKASGIKEYNQCSRLRNQILLCGATVGSGGTQYCHLSSNSMGCLGMCISLFKHLEL